MQSESRKVTSNQQAIHPDLESIVTKHISTKYLKPITEFNQKAFEYADKIYQQHRKNFILDSGCGVGESTYQLANKYPEAFVLGVDQSSHRVNSNNEWTLPDNAYLLRADLVDFWRLAVAADWQLSRHYILYPNPWPKKKHLQRRWHGHPVFYTLKELGGILELRTNWQLYAEEFSQAITILCENECQVLKLTPEQPISPFERKYQLSGQDLYRISHFIDKAHS